MALKHCPVTKYLLTIIVCAYLGAPLLGDVQQLELKPENPLELWRLFTCQLFFHNTWECFLGLLLAACWSTFETRYGSSKYASTLVFLSAASTLLQVAFMTTFHDLPSLNVASGPYGVLFGLLMAYYLDVPALTPIRVSCVTLSDKSVVYFLSFLLLFSRYPYSFYSGTLSLIPGFLHRARYYPFHTFRIPAWIERLSYYFLAEEVSKEYPAARHRTVPHSPAFSRLNAEMLQRAAEMRATQSVYGPSQDDATALQTLLTLGFPEDRARRALAASGNDVHLAVSRLVT